MKLAQINAVCGGSTGRICRAIADKLGDRGDACRICYALGESGGENCFRYTDALTVKTQALRARVLGNYGFNSRAATEKLIRLLDGFGPDLIQLHNLHTHDLDLERLFGYFRERNSKLVWTFHDCWAFTGYCVHFDGVGCEKWKTLCRDCPQRGAYSIFLDRSEELYRRKQRLFEDVDLTIVTPSEWMAGLVGESFLRDRPISVIPNGVDRSVFRPRPSDFRKEHGLEGKKLVLGVSYQWSGKKGLDVFEELARSLPEDYRIVLVGTDEKVERGLNERIIPIRRTQDPGALAAIYSAADVFVNPTREDTFPTVNLEALGCGTPVVTFRTGGSAECLAPYCGLAVEKNDVTALRQAIRTVAEDARYSPERCVERAEYYDRDSCFARYLTLYDTLIKDTDT